MRILMVHPRTTLQADQQIFLAEQRLKTRIREAETYDTAIACIQDPDVKTDLILIHADMAKMGTGSKDDFWQSAKSIPVVVYASSQPSEVVPPGVEVVQAIHTEEFVDMFCDGISKLISERRFEAVDSDHGYLRIKSRLLLSMRELKSDVFIRLSDRKFLKLFHAGDEFGEDDFKKYTQKKKVDFLYIKEGESDKFVAIYVQNLRKVVADTTTSALELVRASEEAHETLHELIDRVGFNQAVQDLAQDQVNMTVAAIQKMPDMRELLKKMDETTGRYIAAHSSRLGVAASWFCSAMGWDSGETFTKLCLAAYLHDITLDNDELAKIKTLDELELKKGLFRPDEIRSYKEHPQKAMDLARKIKSLPLEVDTIIYQHHERYDSKGFPQRLNAQLVTPLASAFNMAHDYVDYQLERGKDASLKEFLEQMAKLYTVGHYKRIHRQLKTLA